ncbi:Transposase [Anaerobiospirillum thomasii]|uniref:IS1634 family transposase n=1 Tax=Anaerobiospirillum thomasii TaxID=179995 RepID=UPI000D9AE71A|nr:hypothetical protein [Anaerobiospirillum thomasii]SPT68267.1 Transposase [Anaerobiospirillum thomasii]
MTDKNLIDKARNSLPRVYINAKGKDEDRIVYVIAYELVYVEGKSYKKNSKTIGRIESADGFGTINFNAAFLRDNPIFDEVTVKRIGRNTSKNNAEKSQFSFELKKKDNKTKQQKNQMAKPDVDTTPEIFAEPRIMKFGASYFIKSVIENSASGRALRQLNLSKIRYNQLLTVLVYIIACGIDQIEAIEYYVRDHIVPYKKNMNKDVLYNLWKHLDEATQRKFFELKQTIIHNSTCKMGAVSKTKYFALDGSNCDCYARNISKATYGKSKSGTDTPIVSYLSMIDQKSGELVSFYPYSGSTPDISTLEGAVKHSLKAGCDDYCLVTDRGYSSSYNISFLYDKGINFLMHLKASSSHIKAIIRENIDALCCGNNCSIIRHEKEVNYAMQIEKLWSYGNRQKGKERNRAKIYLYLFYNKDIYQETKDFLISTIEEANVKYDDYKRKLAKAKKQHKSNPEMDLSSSVEKLMKDNIIILDKTTNRFIFNNEKGNIYCHESSVWILASSLQLSCEDAFNAYRERNNIEVMYRYLKDQVDASTMHVSSDTSFTGKLFVSLLASEFLNMMNLKIKQHNKTAPECDKVKLKSNSLSMTFKDLDLIECTQYADEIIPKTNLSKNYEKLFQIFNVDPIDLKTDYYQGAGLE